MLTTPVPSVLSRSPRSRKFIDLTPLSPADGPRKDAVESLQKQIDYYVGETYRLRSARNSHAPVSRLPAELLTEAFLQIVESGLQVGKTYFATGTFNFLQVCKHWNEMAVNFPQLWRWWVAGAVKAWSLFNSRSKDTPLTLTWRPQIPISARGILRDPTFPKRIHQLDFVGTGRQLARFSDAFDSNPPSNVSSIRLQISPHDGPEPREDLARFLSSPFPKLSQLDLGNFLPDSSSSIFTTSNLTSLKLFLPYGRESFYTLSQFSKILHRHPNLQELDLGCGAMPLPGPTVSLVPPALPQLVSLRLHGRGAAILGFVDLIGMSSPLHDVVIRFHHDPQPTVPALGGIVARVLVAYYECQGLDHPRKLDHLTISSSLERECLVFNARSRSAPTSNSKSNLRFQFNGTGEFMGGAMVKKIFPLFPLSDLREFTAEGPVVCGDQYGEMFRMMKNLLHLRLDNQDIFPALEALSIGNQGSSRILTKPTSTHPSAHSRSVSTTLSKAGVVNPISP